MCYQVKCITCGKSTWAGCGRHVASVHAQIPEGQHCACRDWPGVALASPIKNKASDDAGKTSGAAAAAASEGSAGSAGGGGAAQ